MRKIIFILLFITTCFATDYWVDATNGNDGNDGLTISTPKQTLGAIDGLVGIGDTCYCLGTFTEVMTFVDAHDNSFWTTWPDSAAYWAIDGGAARNCVVANQGFDADLNPTIHRCKIFNSSLVAVYGTPQGFLTARSCTISCATGGSYGIYWDGELILDSCYVVSGATEYAAALSDGIMYASYTVFAGGYGISVSADSYSETYRCGHVATDRHFYGINDQGIMCVEDTFIIASGNTCILTGSGDTQHILLNKCKFYSPDQTGKALDIVGDAVFVRAINCTFDSLTNSIVTNGFRHVRALLLNCIFANMTGQALLAISDCEAAGCYFYNNAVDTASCDRPITFTTGVDPQLDANQVAQATLTGANTLWHLEAPMFDDLGHCFRSDSDTPHPGWRSRHSETTCCSGGGGDTGIEWTIRSPARRLEGHE